MVEPSSKRLPDLVLLNRQRSVVLDLAALEARLLRALPLCAVHSADGVYALRSLEEVVVSLVSDRRIAQIHRDFMNIPGATDVITFEHGEIIISAQTAMRCAGEYGHSTLEEAALYAVHGMLHLNGFLDGTDDQRQVMHALQEGIWLASRR